MTTFDQVLPKVAEILRSRSRELEEFGKLYVNRDLNGRVRLVAKTACERDSAQREVLEDVADIVASAISPHSFDAAHTILYEDDPETVLDGRNEVPIDGLKNVFLLDRLATEGDWGSVAKDSPGPPRIVYFSIKGGVGRSTALAVSAWALAEAGKRVLVVDLDLESPGLSSSLLPIEKRPIFGVADWLVEDLVGNAAAVFGAMVATSELSHNGEISVVPAHGADPGEYVSKLGRVWMPKISGLGKREPWSTRLNRLLSELEQKLKPDVVLIDSRAGIDEVASACVTDIGAKLILLFAIDGDQTWSGYDILLEHWRKSGSGSAIRERLQVVGAMIPEVDGASYFQALCERSWTSFSKSLYDEIEPGQLQVDAWAFNNSDEEAPHYPWPIRWNRGFAAVKSLHSRIDAIDPVEVESTFGPLVRSLLSVVQE